MAGASAEGKVRVVIEGEDKTGSAFDSASSKFSTFGKAAVGFGVGAAAVAGTAVAGIAAKGVQAFTGFQQGFLEVMTLLPGETAQATDKMKNDILSFSNETGKLPEQVLPALYQALSAGVPQDTVFDFMETANKAAIAGVSTLETSVVGVTFERLADS